MSTLRLSSSIVFFSSRRRHTRCSRDWSSDMCSSDLALREGYYATFMPKPLFGQNGSGMHTHQSIFKGERNIFFDPNEKKYHLSTMAKQYIAGVFKHIQEINLARRKPPGLKSVRLTRPAIPIWPLP